MISPPTVYNLKPLQLWTCIDRGSEPCFTARRFVQKPYSQIMWFEPDDCSRVANNVVSFAIRYTYDETGSPNFLASLTQVLVSSVITTASFLETLDGSVEPWPDSGSVQRRS